MKVILILIFYIFLFRGTMQFGGLEGVWAYTNEHDVYYEIEFHGANFFQRCSYRQPMSQYSIDQGKFEFIDDTLKLIYWGHDEPKIVSTNHNSGWDTLFMSLRDTTLFLIRVTDVKPKISDIMNQKAMLNSQLWKHYAANFLEREFQYHKDSKKYSTSLADSLHNTYLNAEMEMLNNIK